MSEDLSDILLHTPQTVVDALDGRDHIYQIGERAARTPIDKLVDLSGLREYRKPESSWPDQGRTSACTCYAGEHWLWQLRNRIFEGNPPAHLSALGAYNAYRASMGQISSDRGLTVRDYMRGTREIGLWPRSFWNPQRTLDHPPEGIEDHAIRFPGSYYSIPVGSDKTLRFPAGTDYTIRAALNHIKVEKLPVMIATRIPEGDMRSIAVRRTGIRSACPNFGRDDKGYAHMEFIDDARWVGEEIYFEVCGSWGSQVGDRGVFYLPASNLINPHYTLALFAPKEDWA